MLFSLSFFRLIFRFSSNFRPISVDFPDFRRMFVQSLSICRRICVGCSSNFRRDFVEFPDFRPMFVEISSSFRPNSLNQKDEKTASCKFHITNVSYEPSETCATVKHYVDGPSYFPYDPSEQTSA